MTHYDYVIVGGGAAGCVLAARLSEDRSASVLLLEAGGSSRSLWVDMPAAVGHAIDSGRFSTTYRTEPQPRLGHRRIDQIQGRTLGGSSAINGMMYVRGHKQDYDDWVQAGATGWSYDEVLPYFRRAERHVTRDDGFHGRSGPLGVSSPVPERLSPLHRAFVAAGMSAGHGYSADFNGAEQHGFGYFDQTIAGGIRSSAARAYLDPARSRPNLTIRTGQEVHSIVFDRGRATGVRPVGVEGAIGAGRVVLTAGAYASPAILLRSGVGPHASLQEAGFRTLLDLPGVGENLQNHPDIAVQFATRVRQSLRRAMAFPAKQLAGLQWLARREGIAASNHFEAGAFVKSHPDLDRPDLQLTFFNLALHPDSNVPLAREAFQVHATLVRPQSRGRVRITSEGLPAIDLNYLASDSDRVALQRALPLLRTIASQPGLAPFIAEELLPGPEVQNEDSINVWLSARLASFYHPAGTCRMGQADDPMAVVSPNLGLRGASNVFVADASVMPAVPAGNTYAPTVMIAEKAADLIHATA